MLDQIKNTKAVEIIKTLTENKYDFIALQEASYLYDKLKSIKNYKIIFSSNKGFTPDDNDSTGKLITLYNCVKYDLIIQEYGKIEGINNTRPFHILYLQDKNDINKTIIFINLHNIHKEHRNNDIDKDYLLEAINFKINKMYKFLDNVHIIISGDFNDEGIKYYERGLKIKINSTDVLVKSDNTPPKTCCFPSNYSSIGDYILYSKNLNPIMDNTIFNYDRTTSDHYPIHIELNYNQVPGAISVQPIQLIQPATLLLVKKAIDKLSGLFDQYLNMPKKIDK
jgi:hypothetical protein